MRRWLWGLGCGVVWMATAVSSRAETEAETDGGPPDYFNEHTIRPADVPANAPRFSQYAVKERFRGKPAAPDVRSHPRSRLFRTMIREGARNGPNFAGHYTLVFWGCGTGCRQMGIVDARTGRVFHPRNLLSVEDGNLDWEGFEAAEKGFDIIRYSIDSKLIRTVGYIDEDDQRRGISWFVWDKEQLRRIRFIHQPGGLTDE